MAFAFVLLNCLNFDPWIFSILFFPHPVLLRRGEIECLDGHLASSKGQLTTQSNTGQMRLELPIYLMCFNIVRCHFFSYWKHLGDNYCVRYVQFRKACPLLSVLWQEFGENTSNKLGAGLILKSALEGARNDNGETGCLWLCQTVLLPAVLVWPWRRSG